MDLGNKKGAFYSAFLVCLDTIFYSYRKESTGFVDAVLIDW